MGRKSANRPLMSGTANGDSKRNQASSTTGVDFEVDDDVDQYVSSRHEKLASNGGLDSDSEGALSADEPEVMEHEILPLDVSDSEDDEEGDEIDDDDDDDDDGDLAGDDGKDWGGRRRMWYGGDTHEYEVMEDGERAEVLKEEEEEAIKLQKEAMSSLRAEDFGNEEEEDESILRKDDEEEEEEEEEEAINDTEMMKSTSEKEGVAGPELILLLEETIECEKKMEIWGGRASKNETATVLFNLYASFVSNVAFFLVLRTDPDAKDADLRRHPVIARIVRIRSLLTEALKLSDANREDWDDENVEDNQKMSGSSEDDDEEKEENSDDNGRNENRKKKKKKGGKKKKDSDVVDGNDIKLSKKKKKRKKSEVALKTSNDTNIQTGNVQIDEDDDDEDEDDDVRRLLQLRNSDENETSTADVAQDRKRRKLNRLVDEMERERKNKESRRMASADMERVRQERPKLLPGNAAYAQRAGDPEPSLGVEGNGDGMTEGLDGGDDDDEVMKRMSVLKKKEKNQARKERRAAEMVQPHVYTFDDRLDEDAKRKANSQVVKNRGLTRYRPRDKKTPRTKNRAAYTKAMKKRKSVAKEYQGKPGGGYSGEATGINMSVRRSSKLSSV